MPRFKIHHLPLVAALVAMMLPAAARAEEDPPPSSAAASWTGEVSGSVVNLTGDAGLPPALELMLHTWSPEMVEKSVNHAESDEDGSFHFDDVTLSAGDVVSAMALYEGATYMAQPVEVRAGDESISLELPIYESTSDLAGVTIDQAHVFIMPDYDGLSVSEVYVVSNRGDRTVQGADVLDDGTPVTLKFKTQPEADSVTFGYGGQERYRLFPGGFAYTAPLLPGEQSAGIMLTYFIPYQNEGKYVYTSQLPTGGVNFLTPVNSGLELSAADLELSGVWPLRDGSTVTVYEHSGLLPGEELVVDITGQLVEPVYSGYSGGQATAGKPAATANLGLAAGGAALGAALLVVGVWWWRRTDEPDLDDEDEDEEDEVEVEPVR